MKFKVRKIFAQYRSGAGLSSTIVGVLPFGYKIKRISSEYIDNTEWIQFAKGKQLFWIDIGDLKL